MSTLHVDDAPARVDPLSECDLIAERRVLPERNFRNSIAIERKRAERSKEPFLLMLVERASYERACHYEHTLEQVAAMLLQSSRETDVVGWYREKSAVGAMFTSLVLNDRKLIRNTILARLSLVLENDLPAGEIERLTLSFHFYPDDWNADQSDGSSDRALYPDLTNPARPRKSGLVMKRIIDVVGSAIVMIALFPLFVAIALAVRLTSKGPVLFRQIRVGHYGRQFVLYKFRTMFTGSDSRVHRDYVTKLIADQAERKPAGAAGNGVYKLTNDPRITRVGKLLRRTSMDELPQILNVFKGDMSLVGPRPPIPYELAAYQTWHRRRVLEAKPGVTGLWQVTGRSSVRFDEMVRLDLRYATSWSLWLDLKILLRTPVAVFRGAGAF